jgi:hypothetical protein
VRRGLARPCGAALAGGRVERRPEPVGDGHAGPLDGHGGGAGAMDGTLSRGTGLQRSSRGATLRMEDPATAPYRKTRRPASSRTST